MSMKMQREINGLKHELAEVVATIELLAIEIKALKDKPSKKAA